MYSCSMPNHGSCSLALSIVMFAGCLLLVGMGLPFGSYVRYIKIEEPINYNRWICVAYNEYVLSFPERITENCLRPKLRLDSEARKKEKRGGERKTQKRENERKRNGNYSYFKITSLFSPGA